MYSRLVFEILRNAEVPEAVLVRFIALPAESHGLRGNVRRLTGTRLGIVLEGSRDDIVMFEAVLDYVSIALGDVTGIHSSHGHPFPTFANPNVTNSLETQ